MPSEELGGIGNECQSMHPRFPAVLRTEIHHATHSCPKVSTNDPHTRVHDPWEGGVQRDCIVVRVQTWHEPDPDSIPITTWALKLDDGLKHGAEASCLRQRWGGGEGAFPETTQDEEQEGT